MTGAADREDAFGPKRSLMVVRQLRGRDIHDERVLAAMESVPRERFVPASHAASAYDDHPLAIGAGQTISQPYIVALMTQAVGLDQDSNVLEIGTGSGYGAAVLSRVARRVVTVERLSRLAHSATDLLGGLGYANVDVVCADGTLGWPARAPYEGIVVTAGGPKVPTALIDQLCEGGRLVIPVTSEQGDQRLIRVVRHGSTSSREELAEVRFVPLIGKQGW
ncbi:MAG: protein-L-isoaspartate(D-aspartate) O-methyltransferase [Acidimicrobiales bacterium]